MRAARIAGHVSPGQLADVPDGQVPKRLCDLIDSLASRLTADASVRAELIGVAERVKSMYRAASRNIP